MPATTTKGLRYPVGADNNDMATDYLNLATDIDNGLVQAFTSVQIAAFTAAQKWNRRRVYDSTIGIWLEYNSTATAWQACVGEKILRLTGNQVGVSMSWTAETIDYEGWITPTNTTITCPAGKGGLFLMTVSCTAYTGSAPAFAPSIGAQTPPNQSTNFGTGGGYRTTALMPMLAGETSNCVVFGSTTTGGVLELIRLSY